MKILEASKMREADAYTIKHEPIDSIQLMERAAWNCCDWIFGQDYRKRKFKIFCGTGNNGGDGLAIARMLADELFAVQVYLLDIGRERSPDNYINLERLEDIEQVRIHTLQRPEQFPALSEDDVVIDALFGSGLNKALDGLAAELILHMNRHRCTVLSIDLPSGMFAEDNYAPFSQLEGEKPIVRADYTLTFETPFLAFFLPENDAYVGEVVIINIGLHPAYMEHLNSQYATIEGEMIKRLFRRRKKFSHKGTFGHALCVAGSYGKMGAAILASRAALRSGLGLLTVHFPHLAYDVMQMSVPEAMASIDPHDYQIGQLPSVCDFSAVGFGPGVGTKAATGQVLEELLNTCNRPVVIDADGLNLLAERPELLQKLHPDTVLTPHPKEFERLFGRPSGAYNRLQELRAQARQLNVVIVLKGAHTAVALPDGRCYFNTTGNPGMATAGSGDTLFGIILALLAQGYSAADASIIGVYIHGAAGDVAAQKMGQTALIASDIIEHLGKVFQGFES